MASINLQPDTMKSVYPTINASTTLKQTAKGKVVMITGAGRGLEVNLKGVYLFSRQVLPIMLAQGAGHIIITASRAATRSDEKMSSYKISKLAATRLCECIHTENHEMGIQSFAIHPRGIVTRLLTDLETKETKPWASVAVKTIRPKLREEISLPGNSCVLLASGQVEFLSGRYADLTISFDYIIQEQKTIEEHDLFNKSSA